MFEPFMCCICICTSLTCKMCILRTNFLKKTNQVIFSKWNLSTMFGYSRRSNRNEDSLIYHTGHFGSKVIFGTGQSGLIFRGWYGYNSEMKLRFSEKLSRTQPCENTLLIAQNIWSKNFRFLSKKNKGSTDSPQLPL